ncbi:MAG: hypothetical protein HY826_09050 [Actinobacteria bacterium]|nr:hypothetical protein [Actinomycetota bacterium]
MNVESCADFEDHMEALAIGEMAEPESSRLLAHAANCPSCQAHLDTVSGLVDSMLQLTPRVEPPPGFESRVLARLHAGTRAHSARWRSLAIVVACTAALVGGVALGRTALGRDGDSASLSAGTVARSGIIARPDGSPLGNARLVAGPQPFVLVTIDNPKDSGAEVWCELVLADGQSVTVGSWGYDDVAGGVWATGIESGLLAAVTMRVVAADGSVLATATLD